MPNRKSIYGFIYGGNFIAQKAEGFSPQKRTAKAILLSFKSAHDRGFVFQQNVVRAALYDAGAGNQGNFGILLQIRNV